MKLRPWVRRAAPGPQESDRWAELAVLARHSSRDVSYPDPEERAVQSLVHEALGATPHLPTSRLWLDLRHSEAIYLARLGRFAEADAIRVSLRPLYDQHPDKAMLQHWLRALVKAGLGDHEAAAASFRFTRDGFVLRKNPFDAALVTLDWTLYLLDQNRPADVVPLAVSMGQTFEALGVARETIASWALFREAAERLELQRAEAAAWGEVLDFEQARSARYDFGHGKQRNRRPRTAPSSGKHRAQRGADGPQGAPNSRSRLSP